MNIAFPFIIMLVALITILVSLKLFIKKYEIPIDEDSDYQVMSEDDLDFFYEQAQRDLINQIKKKAAEISVESKGVNALFDTLDMLKKVEPIKRQKTRFNGTNEEFI